MKTLSLAMRSLIRVRLYSYMNMAGLGLALSCFIILTTYIHQELTVDHFATDPDRTFLLTVQYQNGGLGLGSPEHGRGDNFIHPLEDPAVLMHTYFKCSTEDNIRYNEYDYSANIVVTDNNFLKILPFPVIAGNSEFNTPNEVFLTKDFANKLFGKEDPLGKTIIYDDNKLLTVAGILDHPHTKSSITFDLLLPYDLQEHWSIISQTLVLLAPGSNYKELNRKNGNFMDLSYYWSPMRYQFFPLKNFYFDKSINTSYLTNILRGDKSSLWILGLVSLLLISIGLFNFINLYTVIIIKRSREFGVKKVYGVGSVKIFKQLFSENMLLIGGALLLAWVLTEILYWFLYRFFALELRTTISFNIELTSILLILLSILSCLYPFIKHNYSNPITSLRAVGLSNYSVNSRMFILSVQYILTFSLIISALFFMKQLNYMLNIDLGYNTTDIIRTELIREKRNHEYIEGYHEDIQNRRKIIHDKIAETTLFFHQTTGTPNDMYPGTPFQKGGGEFHNMAVEWVSNEFFTLFNIQLKEGRLWDSEKDEWAQYKMIINETAQKLFNIQNFETDVLQPEHRLWMSSNVEGMDTNPPYEIVGIVKDFHIGHLSKGVPPIAFLYDGEREGYSQVVASIVPGKKQEAIHFLQELHKEHGIGGEFSYSFLEDEITAMYTKDKEIARIYLIFAIIAILISCLGLFGISMFDIQRRYHEIALRKVNGATTQEIILLLLKRYVRLLTIAFAISIPVTWLGIHYYLQDFANKTTLSWWIYLIALIITSIISFITLYYHIQKAANMNPAEVVKSE